MEELHIQKREQDIRAISVLNGLLTATIPTDDNGLSRLRNKQVISGTNRLEIENKIMELVKSL